MERRKDGERQEKGRGRRRREGEGGLSIRNKDWRWGEAKKPHRDWKTRSGSDQPPYHSQSFPAVPGTHHTQPMAKTTLKRC